MSSPERAALEQVEQALHRGEREGPLASLAWLAAHDLLDQPALHGPVRRALLLLAAGGDPRRGLTLTDRAVTSLAAEIHGLLPAGAVRAGLGRLEDEATGLPAASGALSTLVGDEELAVRALACALLAEEIEEPPG